MNTKADSECPICSRHSEDVLTTQMRRGKGTVYLCKNCNHGFFVTQEDLDAKEYYASEYRKEYSHNSEQAATNAKELFDVYKNYQKDRLSFILSNEKDSKTLLQEFLQSLDEDLPEYVTTEKKQNGEIYFVSKVTLPIHNVFGEGQGKSKKLAGQEAASNVLIMLNKDGK